jgi:hypothetical protein
LELLTRFVSPTVSVVATVLVELHPTALVTSDDPAENRALIQTTSPRESLVRTACNIQIGRRSAYEQSLACGIIDELDAAPASGRVSLNRLGRLHPGAYLEHARGRTTSRQ